MKPSVAVKITNKALEVFKSYIACAHPSWDIEDEGDYENFKDCLLDTIGSTDEED